MRPRKVGILGTVLAVVLVAEVWAQGQPQSPQPTPTGVPQGLHAEDGYTHVEIADCHVHLLDFLQNGDFYVNGKFVRGGTPNQPLRPGQRIEALLKMMGYAHVSQALVMGMPFVKKWSANDP